MASDSTASQELLNQWYYNQGKGQVTYSSADTSVWLEYSTLKKHPSEVVAIQAEVPWDCQKISKQNRELAERATAAYEADRENVNTLLTTNTRPYEELTLFGKRLYDKDDWTTFLAEGKGERTA